MTPSRIPILTYHGYNVKGNDYCTNDHVALAEDIAWFFRNGWTVVSLSAAVNHVFGFCVQKLPEKCVCLTFDDGTDLDWTSAEFENLGKQKSFFTILMEAKLANPQTSGLHATAFVIASPSARKKIAEDSLEDAHHMSDMWWSEAESSKIMSIGNHSWDHRHPAVLGSEEELGFLAVDNEEEAVLQVVESGNYIEKLTSHWPPFFAYPWGQASDYLRFEFFPSKRAMHRCQAAFGTEPEHMTSESDRWFLPRYVCGYHWTSSQELVEILKC